MVESERVTELVHRLLHGTHALRAASSVYRRRASEITAANLWLSKSVPDRFVSSRPWRINTCPPTLI